MSEYTAQMTGMDFVDVLRTWMTVPGAFAVIKCPSTSAVPLGTYVYSMILEETAFCTCELYMPRSSLSAERIRAKTQIGFRCLTSALLPVPKITIDTAYVGPVGNRYVYRSQARRD